MKRDILIYGILGGILITLLKLTEYRFLVLDRSIEIYGALVAAMFAGLGIWLGLRLRNPGKSVEKVVIREVPVLVEGPFVFNEAKRTELGITPRELEILDLIAKGFSNREIAETLFVSENTVKTH